MKKVFVLKPPVVGSNSYTDERTGSPVCAGDLNRFFQVPEAHRDKQQLTVSDKPLDARGEQMFKLRLFSCEGPRGSMPEFRLGRPRYKCLGGWRDFHLDSHETAIALMHELRHPGTAIYPMPGKKYGEELTVWVSVAVIRKEK